MKQTYTKSYLAMLVWMSMTGTILHGIPTMSLSIRPYPEDQKNQSQAMGDKLKKPANITRKILKYYHVHPGGTAGVIATYMGSIAVSNFDGLITFERKHKGNIVQLLITQQIQPVMMLSSIVHHWSVNPMTPAALYNIERKQDPTTKLYYWTTTEQTIPENHRISLDTIVIFAKPESFVVPLGSTLTTDFQQFILPTIYTKKIFNPTARSLSLLKLRHFFSGQQFDQQKPKDDVYFSRQIKN